MLYMEGKLTIQFTFNPKLELTGFWTTQLCIFYLALKVFLSHSVERQRIIE